MWRFDNRQSVLDSVNGNQERAADVLLGMSDPSYESQQHAAPVSIILLRMIMLS